MELSELSRKRLQELFVYRDGELWWRKRPYRSSIDITKPAGTVTNKGYRQVQVLGRTVRLHRLIWCYVHGCWPKTYVDHIDGNPLNNRIENLRAADCAENSRNRKLPSTNKSGLRGVFWHKHKSKWVARVNDGKRQIHLGTFACPAAASLMYQVAVDYIHGEYACSIEDLFGERTA